MTEKKLIKVVAAVIEREGRYLITQRRPTAVLPLLWEFPGGKVEEGETYEEALKREMLERLSVPIIVGSEISSTTHEYPGYIVELHLFDANLLSRSLKPQKVYAFRWVISKDFEKYQFTPADEISMSKLLNEK